MKGEELICRKIPVILWVELKGNGCFLVHINRSGIQKMQAIKN
jgi:hypothetical protein